MRQDVLDNLTVDLMIEHIARGHAFNKHVLGEDKSKSMNGVNALRAKYDNKGRKLGPDLRVNTVLDLRHYIKSLLDKEDTIGFVNPRNGSITLYQQSDNVIMHFNQNDRQHDYGSIYRYYDSRDDFYKKMALANAVPDEDVRHKFNFLSNNAVAGSKNIREALEDMVVGIKHEPYKYTTKPNTHVVNARFIVALENDFRPGRKEMSGAPNNGIFHSGEYAQINELNIMGPLSINSSQTISLLAVCKIDYDAVEYSNIAEALREGDDNDDFTYEEGLDMF